jgi:hypothetical protein
MAAGDFISQLRALGFKVEELGDGKIIIPYSIPLGPRRGTNVRIGFMGFADFPQNPPSCLHISPHLMPINTNGGAHPFAGIHPNPNFGDDWQYWSRPLQHWGQTPRTAKDVIAHVKHLLDTLK